MTKLRAAILQTAFRLLYGPLVFLHEPLGGFLWGNAWAARRLHLIDYLQPGSRILDVGCGEGNLLAELGQQGFSAAGVEPSRSMRRNARRKSLNVRPGYAQRIPWPDSSFDAVVATYPGDWIFDAATWSELRRVTIPDGRIAVLLGGDYRRGPLARLRSILIRLIYPSSAANHHPQHNTPMEDSWGTYYLLICDLD